MVATASLQSNMSLTNSDHIITRRRLQSARIACFHYIHIVYIWDIQSIKIKRNGVWKGILLGRRPDLAMWTQRKRIDTLIDMDEALAD